MRYLDPKNEFAFRKVFRDPETLLSFLNAVLVLPKERHIDCLQYIDVDALPDTPLKKDAVLAVSCVDNLGSEFLVELHLAWSGDFNQRTLYNLSSVYEAELVKSSSTKIMPLYVLCIITDKLDSDIPFSSDSECPKVYELSDDCADNANIGNACLEFVELDRYDLTCASTRDLWLSLIKNVNEEIEDEDLCSSMFENEKVSKALRTLRARYATKAELYYYERCWDTLSTHRTIVSDAGRNRVSSAVNDYVKSRVLYKHTEGCTIAQIAYAFDISLSDVESIIKSNQ